MIIIIIIAFTIHWRSIMHQFSIEMRQLHEIIQLLFKSVLQGCFRDKQRVCWLFIICIEKLCKWFWLRLLLLIDISMNDKMLLQSNKCLTRVWSKCIRWIHSHQWRYGIFHYTLLITSSLSTPTPKKMLHATKWVANIYDITTVTLKMWGETGSIAHITHKNGIIIDYNLRWNKDLKSYLTNYNAYNRSDVTIDKEHGMLLICREHTHQHMYSLEHIRDKKNHILQPHLNDSEAKRAQEQISSAA